MTESEMYQSHLDWFKNTGDKRGDEGIMTSRKNCLSLIGGVAAFLLVLTPNAFAKPSSGGLQATVDCGDGVITYSPSTIWPPHHKMQQIDISFAESELTSDSDTLGLQVTGISSNLYDILMNSFSTADKNSVMRNLDAIREAFIVLMTQDQEFIDAIELSTSSRQAVRMRFDKWRLALEAVLATTVKQPRCFSRALKAELYAKDSTCKICLQHIADLDDAAVDHIEMYWLGGKTIPENARLTHRYCNWARPKAA